MGYAVASGRKASAASGEFYENIGLSRGTLGLVVIFANILLNRRIARITMRVIRMNIANRTSNPNPNPSASPPTTSSTTQHGPNPDSAFRVSIVQGWATETASTYLSCVYMYMNTTHPISQAFDRRLDELLKNKNVMMNRKQFRVSNPRLRDQVGPIQALHAEGKKRICKKFRVWGCGERGG
eukprot:897936-Amorphochlora_amoeboformis.AAC.2